MDAISKLEAIAHPGHHRTTVIRRLLAAGCIAVAVMSLAIDVRRSDPLVSTFSQPVAAGALLTEDDVTLTRLPAEAIPDNAIDDPSLVVGHILAASASRGEVVTSTRLVGPDLVTQLVEEESPGEAFTMVPLPLAEPDIMPMLHHGARVDVVGQGPRVIASGGKIVTVGDQGTVLVLLRESEAAAVAATSLTDPLTVVLSASRPQFSG